jgi:alpha-tubulin suppressor-like RCC1 family protein/sRNA-binding regulator protein Hfq
MSFTRRLMVPLALAGLACISFESGASLSVAGATQIVTGRYHSCALTAAGGVRCWGDNSHGQLGDDGASGTLSLVPVDVVGLTSGVVSIAAGYTHTCAIDTSGALKCWGENGNGQLGDNTATSSGTPVDVAGLSDTPQPSAGLSVTGGAAGFQVDGGPVNPTLQLTAGNRYRFNINTSITDPVCVQTDTLFNGNGTKYSGASPQTCFNAGAFTVTVPSSGYPPHLYLISDTHGTSALITINLTAALRAVSVAGGASHTCAVTTAGGAKCWGSNSNGQLGDTTLNQSLLAQDVSGLASGVIAVTAGFAHTCAITSAGAAKCWGVNGSGQLGNGSMSQSPPPIDVTGLASGVTAITAGDIHTCAIVSGGAKCWGSDQNGRLGDGSTSPRLTPFDVTGLTGGVAAIRAGDNFTCALTTGGEAKCWGWNSNGQLGDGTNTEHHTAIDPSGLTSGAVGIAAGGYHSCFLTSSGLVKCTGDNTFGAVGDGTIAQRRVPTQVQAATFSIDFNADDKGDLVFQNTDGRVVTWLMNGMAPIASAGILGPGTSWHVARMADMDGDGKPDIVWQNPDGRVTIYLMNGASATLKTQILGAGGWTVAQAGDLDGDGKADLVFQHTDGTIAAWLMNGTSMTSGATLLGPGSGWSVTGIADFDGDGRKDLLFTHTDGRVAIWLMNGLTPTATAQILNAGTGWSVTSTPDLDVDGKADIVWRHTDGSIALWLMDGTTVSSGAGILGPGSGWSVALAADFDGDGRADLFFQHTDGRAAIWLMNGLTSTTQTQILNAGGGWSARRTLDLNGDAKSDIVWQNADGRVAVWLMNGTVMTSGGEILGPASGWSVSGASQ